MHRTTKACTCLEYDRVDTVDNATLLVCECTSFEPQLDAHHGCVYGSHLCTHTICRTPLHLTIECRNKPVFDVLLQREQIDCDVKSSQGFPPLYDALRVFSEDPSYAKGLVAKGASADVVSLSDIHI